MAEEPYKYWAFISYSHRDQVWAEWLHRALERYRVPRRLVGRASAVGVIPRRLFPVFRDSAELPSSPSLDAVIDEALQHSRYLIVIASPYAAVSRWVDQEIQRFRALGRADRILCLIVDGEPHADASPGKGLLECFPPALRKAGEAEPVGADVRPRKESRASAKLRLIAGLLGVGLDELRRRERRRRRLQIAAWTVAGVLAAATLAAFWQVQLGAKQSALAQQALATHVQTLYEKGRRELQARNEARAAVYLNEAYRLGLDTPALRFMLGRAMRVVDAEKYSIDVGAPVADILFAPDGRRIFTRDQANHAAIWDVASRRKLVAFDLPPDLYPTASFSADGSKLKVIDEREHPQLLVIDTQTGQRLTEPDIANSMYRAHTAFDPSGRHLAFVQPDHRAAIYDFNARRVVQWFARDCVVAGYSRDGRWLLTGDKLGTVRLYDAANRHLLRSFDPLGAPIVDLDTSPDGALLAAAASNGAVRLWEAGTGKIRLSAEHAAHYFGHVFNGMDGSRLLTATQDGARVWDTRTGEQLFSIKFPINEHYHIHISEDGRLLINTGTAPLKVTDVDTGVDLYSLDAHFGGGTAIDFSDDGQWLATAGRDGRVGFLQLPRMPQVSFQHGMGPEDPAMPENLAQVISGFSHGGALGFSGGFDGRAEWWNSRSLQTIRQVSTGFGAVTAAAFSADDGLLAIGGIDALKVWDVASGSPSTQIFGIGKIVRAIRFSADGKIVAAALRGGEARLWQLPTGNLLRRFPIDRFLAVAFSPVAAQLALGKDGRVQLWSLDRKAMQWSTQLGGTAEIDPIRALDFDREGQRILAVSDMGAIDVLDAADGRVLQHSRDETSESTTTAKFSPDGRRVLLSDDNRCAYLMQLADLVAHRLCGHGSDLASAGFNPDGSLIFTASRDGTAKIWDTDGNLLDSVGFHDGAIAFSTTSFNREGDRLLTGATDGSARVWDTAPETRTAAEVAASLGCRVPWRTDGDNLVPVRPDSKLCFPH